MRANQVVIGGKYIARVAGNKTIVRIDEVYPYRGGGWHATNLKTGKQVRIKTAGRLTPVPTPKS